MIDLKAHRERARNWSLPDGVIRNDVDNLCDEVERLNERLAQADALLGQILTDTAQTVPDTFDEIRAYFAEHAPKEAP